MSLASMDRKQKQTDVNDEGKEGRTEWNQGKFFFIFSMTLKKTKDQKKNTKKTERKKQHRSDDI